MTIDDEREGGSKVLMTSYIFWCFCGAAKRRKRGVFKSSRAYGSLFIRFVITIFIFVLIIVGTEKVPNQIILLVFSSS